MWRSLFLAVTLAAVGSKGAAQSMTPMRGEISSFEEEFTVRVFPYNPYPHSIRVAIKAYDQDFRPIEADVMPPEMVIDSMSSRSAIVSVGFKNKKVRRIRICTESVPFPGLHASIKAQICGRFIAHRIN